MFGQKMNSNTFKHLMKTTKSHIGQAYNFSKNIFSNIDSAVRTAKDIYSIASPVLDEVLGSTATTKGNKYIQKALTGYEDIRSKVMDTDDNIKRHYNTIVGGLQKKQIDIGL